MSLAVVLALLGHLPAQADPQVLVTIRSNPAGAQVSDQFGYLGVSGTPIPIRLNRFGPSEALATLTFHKDGYQDLIYPCNAELLRAPGVVPPAEEAPVQLVPNTLLTRLRSLSGPGLALALGLLASLGVVLSQARRLRTQKSRDRFVSSHLSANPEGSLAGQVLGPYQLLNRLGEGAMAAVYRAVPLGSLDASQAVAIKVLHHRVVQDPDFLGRFRREVDVSLRLRHPAIVRLDDFGQHEDRYYLVMELVQGSTLREVLPSDPLSPSEAWRYLEPIMQAVQYAHGQGVIHRDLKPENIMVSTEGKPKVADFGLAKPLDSQTLLTQSGAALGTPAYMSPEQIQSQPADFATDQYALGVLAFELLAGRRPFIDQDITGLIFQHLTAPPPPLSELAPLVSSRLQAVIERMLAKGPADRWESVAQAAEQLREALSA